MKLAFAITLTMVAFAANSLLNRAALSGGDIGPAGFSLIRVGAGAVMLLVLLSLRAPSLPRAPAPDLGSVAALVAYLLGFSFAYVALDAGIGALILFGCVQLTMFLGAIAQGQAPGLRRWVGMGVALAGLAVLVWPTQSVQLGLVPVALMVAAGVGWGSYSLRGRRAADALAATTWNFTYALPAVAAAMALLGRGETVAPSGAVLAILSGAVTSGLGYALWYRILPRIAPTNAALVQLSVPIIALGAGALFLAEPLGLRAIGASVLICGGIALGVTSPKDT